MVCQILINGIVFRPAHPMFGHPHAVVPLQIWIFSINSSIVVIHACIASWIPRGPCFIYAPATSAFAWHGLPLTCKKPEVYNPYYLIKKVYNTYTYKPLKYFNSIMYISKFLTDPFAYTIIFARSLIIVVAYIVVNTVYVVCVVYASDCGPKSIFAIF